ncbi:hypothetical protein TDSAC_1703 [Thermodesulfobium acidiphilum]|uniref:Uncharacterized protein n=1 Tax=Thermodesulfobium acidiphilum TaxID=1794699 RepID=A0A2R4W2J9_THEAF|nr:hypothetical protein [Thermodesulfobium acidiphilum]AWB11039.1 hypothetical protein TDSAC_1703 [Thermodesulfobium acidiphilum]
MKEDHEEPLMELKHDPKPGFPLIFAIAFIIGVLYLSYILLNGNYRIVSHQ